MQKVELAELAIEVISNAPKAQEAARKLALRSDLVAEEVDILRGVLQPWWDNERDAGLLCGHLFRLGMTYKNGSVPHRRAVHISVNCARSAISIIRGPARTETMQIFDFLASWARGESTEINLNELRDRAYKMWKIVDHAEQYILFSSYIIASYAVGGNHIEKFAVDADTANAIAVTAPANAVACSLHTRDTPEWNEVYDRHLAELANLIRTEIPICPMGAS